jgi:hypothetical protein
MVLWPKLHRQDFQQTTYMEICKLHHLQWKKIEYDYYDQLV